jgi:hypothetical protein
MGIVASINKGKKKDTDLEFYGKYSFFIFKSLKKPIFQKFVSLILQKENIKKEKIKNIQIHMFPSIKENGNSLAGKCNSKGEVFLFPKKINTCKKIKQKLNSNFLMKYLQYRARASLIHELLHLKYTDNEDKVKVLTKKYFTLFQKKEGSNSLDFKKYNEMIFNS